MKWREKSATYVETDYLIVEHLLMLTGYRADGWPQRSCSTGILPCDFPARVGLKLSGLTQNQVLWPSTLGQ